MPNTSDASPALFDSDAKQQAKDWFEKLRDRLCGRLETIEATGGPLYDDSDPGKFAFKAWERNDGDADDSADGGGGVMGLMKGRVFEKAGVNVSTVWGKFSEEFRKNIPGAEEDPRFWASGISVVIHPRNPHAPAAHMNTRMIVTTKGWFGGGADLTPTFPIQEDTDGFHGGLKAACDGTDPAYYPEYKAWCDRYFYLPHRGETRGVGGIFYDNLNTGDWEADFNFTRAVGSAFVETYPDIVLRRKDTPYDAADRKALKVKRGRYVEFNLLYDRGTLFGLKTGGNTEAILMSLPPEVAWE